MHVMPKTMYRFPSVSVRFLLECSQWYKFHARDPWHLARGYFIMNLEFIGPSLLGHLGYYPWTDIADLAMVTLECKRMSELLCQDVVNIIVSYVPP